MATANEGAVTPEPVAPAVTMKAHQLLQAKVDAQAKEIETLKNRVIRLEEFAELAQGMIQRLRPHSQQNDRTKLADWNPFA